MKTIKLIGLILIGIVLSLLVIYIVTNNKQSEYNYLDVTDLGAEPNDTINDLEAIQWAIEVATTFSGYDGIYFPRGNYLINDTDVSVLYDIKNWGPDPAYDTLSDIEAIQAALDAAKEYDSTVYFKPSNVWTMDSTGSYWVIDTMDWYEVKSYGSDGHSPGFKQ